MICRCCKLCKNEGYLVSELRKAKPKEWWFKTEASAVVFAESRVGWL